MGKAATRMGRVQRSFDRFGTRATAAGQALSVGLTTPIVGLGTIALRSATQFNKGMANVATLIPGNTARVNELKGAVQQLAIAHGKDTTDLAAGLYQTISAFGDQAGDTLRVLEINSKAATAGVATTEQAIALTSSVTKAYGDTSATAVQKVSDLAFLTVKLGQTTFPELAASMGRAVPIAAKLGVSQEELSAGFATLTGVTGNTSEVSTQLAAILRALLKPTPALAAAVDGLGFSNAQALVETLGLKGGLEALIGETDGTNESIGKLFGRAEALNAVFALTGTQSDTFNEKLAAMQDAAGATDTAFREQTEGVNRAGHAWDRLKAKFTVASQQIGDQLAPVLLDLAGALRPVKDVVIGLIDRLTQLSGSQKAVALSAIALGAGLGPVLLLFGGVARALSPLVPLFGRIWIAAGRMSNALVKALVHPIAAAQALRARVVTLRGSLAGLSLSAAAAAVKIRLASAAMSVLRFAIRGVIAALGPMIAVFAAFEFAAWAAGALDLGGKLKRLVGITDDAADAARDADAAYDGFAETLAQTTLATERQALAALERGYQDLVAQLERARESNKRAVPGLLKRVRAQEQAIAAAQDRVKAAQQEVEAEQAAARATTDYTEALQAAEKEAAGITDTTGEQIRAAQKLGVSTEALSQKFGISTEALKIYLGELAEADTPVDDLGDGVGTLSDEVQTLVDRLRGTGAIQAARDWAAALDQVGGLTTLTDAETRQLVGTLETAIVKWRALGEAVPTETYQRFIEATTRLRQIPLADLGLIGTRLDPEQFFAPLRQLTLSDIGPIGIPLEPEITPRFRTKIESALSGFGAEIGQTFARALEGGGGFLGAVQSLGVQAGNRLGTFLSEGLGKRMTAGTGLLAKGLGAVLGKAAGMAIPLIGPVIGSLIGKLFSIGGPSEAERAGRKTAGAFRDGVIATLNDGQLAEASQAALGHWRGNEQGAQFLIGVRDAYVAVGKSAAEAERDVTRLWQAEQRGPEAVAAVQAEIDAVLRLSEESRRLHGELGALKDAGQAAFNPAQIEPYLAKLLDTGTITAQQADALRGLADEAHVDHEAMAAAAEKYGVKLSALGPAFDQARISDAATVIVKDFELMTQDGANVNGVLRDMQDEVQALVTDALTAGVAIPEGMRPILESLVAQGRLTDEDGHKLEDLSRIDFAAPLAAKFDTLIDKLTALIEKITGPSGVTQAIDAIPTDIDIDVGFDVGRLHLPDFGSIQIPARVAGLPALQHGGLVTRPTLATFAEGGPEVAIPLDRMEEFGGGRRVEAKLDQLHQDFALLLDEFRYGLDPRRMARAWVEAGAFAEA